MKFSVPRLDLQSALALADIATENREGDLTSHIVVRASQGGQSVELLSSNGKVGVISPLPGCTVESTSDLSSFTVEAWRLKQWLSAVTDGILEISHDNGLVSATSAKGTVSFQSLDPSSFFFFDSSLGEASSGSFHPSQDIHRALTYVRLFISDQDTTDPKRSVAEVVGGRICGMNRAALATVKSSTLDGPSSEFRLHGKDISPVLSFLRKCGQEDVELIDHPKYLFIRQSMGGVLAVGRPHHAFPDISLDFDDGHPSHFWKVHKGDLISASNALASSASKDEFKLFFSWGPPGKINISMDSTDGGLSTLEIPIISEDEARAFSSQEHQSGFLSGTHGSSEGAVDIPEGGFSLDFSCFTKAVQTWHSEVVMMKINTMVAGDGSPNGYVVISETREDGSYNTAFTWVID